MFPSEATIQRIAAPIVADATRQLGSRADMYELAPERKADASTRLVPNLLLKNDVPILLTMLTSDKAQSTFGLNTEIKMKGVVAKRDAIVAEGALFDVVKGDYAGSQFQVEKLIDLPMSDSYTLGLLYTKAFT